jgi:hypothetical protein
MKRLLPLFSAFLLLAAAAPARAQEPRTFSADGSGRPLFGFDIRLGGVAFDKDCWDDDVGGAVDFGLQVWEPSGIFGFWAGIGVQSASFVWEDDWGEVESDIVAVPVGASLLARLPLGDIVALRGEIGARYVAMDIDDWDDDDYYDRHRRHRNAEWDRYYHPDRYLDVDDTSLAVVSLQLEFDFDPVVLAIGGGYQFDLERPDVEYLHSPIGEVDLSGALFYFAVGLVF